MADSGPGVCRVLICCQQCMFTLAEEVSNYHKVKLFTDCLEIKISTEVSCDSTIRRFSHCLHVLVSVSFIVFLCLKTFTNILITLYS